MTTPRRLPVPALRRGASGAARILLPLCVTATLAACGGGDGGASSPAVPKEVVVLPLPAGTPTPTSLGTISAGAECGLAYLLTSSPLLPQGADPALPEQWHLRQIGAFAAWSASRGAGVRVAVVDDAVEVLHADLRPNLVDGASHSYRPGNRGSIWPLPCSADFDDHGTAVAGLVLARDDNAFGVAGVAPRASLVAFDALSTGQDADIADALLRDVAVNAIYQNSWGAPDDGKLHPAPGSFSAAVRTGIATGRGGRGAIYVFPSGNGGCYNNDLPCQVDNSNYDGFANGLGVIPVCAVDETGRLPYYGEPGANLMVCAPSSGDVPNVVTAALRGTVRKDFSGTSASTPMVSGVVALMLAANPELTWRDVRWLLATTARRNDPSDPGWSAGPDGLWFNHKYGFGTVDAATAVARAPGWVSVGGSDRMRRCETPLRQPRAPIPDASSQGIGTPVIDTIAVQNCGITRIEFVQLQLTTTHTYTGDLRVRLSSPAGAVSELAETRLCGGSGSDRCLPYTGWTFGSARHLGERTVNGAWTLSVTDLSPLDIGTLDNWRLVIHGTDR